MPKDRLQEFPPRKELTRKATVDRPLPCIAWDTRRLYYPNSQLEIISKRTRKRQLAGGIEQGLAVAEQFYALAA